MTEFLVRYVWLVPFYSLLGALFTLPWALGFVRRTGPRPAAYINILMTLLSFIHGSVAFSYVLNHDSFNLNFPWFTIAD